MLFSKGGNLADLEPKLSAAKADLAEAEAAVFTVVAAEDAAAETAASYAKWRADRDRASIEVVRLQRIVAALEKTVEEQRRVEGAELLRKRAAAAQKVNAALAERVRIEGQALSAQLLALVKEVAASTAEAEAINKLLPAGEQRVVDANVLARGRPAIPREIISEKIERLWVFARTGNLVGDQDAVVPNDDGTGALRCEGEHGWPPCIRREFHVVSFFPAEDRIVPEELYYNFQLPHFDRPGGTIPPHGRASPAHFAALNLAPAPLSSRSRGAQTEMTPAQQRSIPRPVPGQRGAAGIAN